MLDIPLTTLVARVCIVDQFSLWFQLFSFISLLQILHMSVVDSNLRWDSKIGCLNSFVGWAILFFVSELSPKVLVKVRYDLTSCCRKNLPIPITIQLRMKIHASRRVTSWTRKNGTRLCRCSATIL